jgi:hypothetical protein
MLSNGCFASSDHIFLPSKGGAMENWGLITYGEEYVLTDKQTAAASEYDSVGSIFAHELAHQVNYLYLSSRDCEYFFSASFAMTSSTCIILCRCNTNCNSSEKHRKTGFPLLSVRYF